MTAAAGGVFSLLASPLHAQAPAAADSSQQVAKHLSFGSRYLKNKQFEDAEAQFVKAWEFSGEKDGRAAYYLGKTYQETERYSDAVTWLEKAAGLVDKSSQNYHNIYYYLGSVHVLLENRPEAIKAYKTLMEIPDLDATRKIQYLHYLVSLNAEVEDFEAALGYARLWGELEPENPEVRDMIAKLAMHAGSADEAISEKEKVLAMNPDDWETVEWLGTQYKQKGDYAKSFDAFHRLHQKDPANFLYLDQLYEVGARLNKPASFQTDLLEQMARIQPQNLRVLELLADRTGSIEWINRGLRVDPMSGRLNYLKGEHYFEQWKSTSSKQDSVSALQWFEKAKGDPQWSDNAQRMIFEINPPLTEEEKAKRDFFDKARKKKEEIENTGKK
jgi:tetratricopeptide (TPR) repeat protein